MIELHSDAPVVRLLIEVEHTRVAHHHLKHLLEHTELAAIVFAVTQRFLGAGVERFRVLVFDSVVNLQELLQLFLKIINLIINAMRVAIE